jgi:uncharacterized protein YqjF (DUF2071 family)
MPRPFLTALWSNVCLISYRVPRALLEPHLPRGLELDVPPGTPTDTGLVSLVAFDFLDTRVKGVRWPRHVNFPEINLRFYVRQADRRGVVFIRELVPRVLISFVARWLYNEPYAAVAMTSRVTQTPQQITVEHGLKVRGGRASSIKVRARNAPSVPPTASLEHWFKEHQWGFGRTRRGEPLVYEVRHPEWAVYPIERFDLDFDWVGVYGQDWGFLHEAEPCSVVLAQGSPIEVHPKRSLKGRKGPTASPTPRA